ncbi:HAMP domain-containing methyl-accepting chemotaxis protein [Methanospirillum lacunae]|uniref:Methyl-accepting chemotaxis protein n=1 Tax=Methanospirillum lacunae TaxID=668570 RepID=A0A2V2N637_9EURY|nr:methyl-accepting chemotaxis protein [Methanospirillum lacunae]PWR73965.1 hypothetical protein DK846_02025 [Methanospirillum lacunae]
MINFDNITLSKKLYTLVTIGIIAIIVVGLSGMYTANLINSQLNEMYEIKYIHTMQAEEANSNLLYFANGVSEYILEEDKTKMDSIKNQSIDKSLDSFNKKISEYEAMKMTDEGKAAIQEIKQTMPEYVQSIEKVLALSYEGKNDEARTLRAQEAVPKRQAIEKKLQNLVDINNQSAYQFYKDTDSLYNQMLTLSIIIIIVSLVALLGFAWFIIKNLTRRFNLLLKGMESVGSGDLSYRINMIGTDELSKVGSSFDSMTINLENQNRKINENLEKSKATNAAILATAEKIKDGNLDVHLDASQYDGEFRVMVQGTNDLVEAFVNPNLEAMRIANEFASGNFSVRYDEKANVKGDFKRFKDALNNSGKSVSDAIFIIKQQMAELTANAEEANASSEEVAASVKSVSDSSMNVSENADKCNNGVTQILKAMEDLNTTVNQVAIKSEQVSKLTNEADKYSKEGVTLASIAERGMGGITTSTNESKEIIEDIREQMEEIGKIVGLIRDISDQTSLLALNAAIEAARAGEAGLGFAVVADEVKSLAQETQTSAENIATIIENLQKRSIQASDAMEKTSKDVEDGGKALQDTLQAFTRIVDLISNINQNVTDVAAATEEQAASVQEITASVTEVGGLVSDTSKEADMSANSTNDVAAAVNQISQVIGNLNGIVENVQNQVNFFKI